METVRPPRADSVFWEDGDPEVRLEDVPGMCPRNPRHRLPAGDVLFADLTEGQRFGGGRGGGRCLLTAASTLRPGHALRSALPATLCFIHLGRSWQREMETKNFLRLSRQDNGLFAAKICFKPHAPPTNLMQSPMLDRSDSRRSSRVGSPSWSPIQPGRRSALGE